MATTLIINPGSSSRKYALYIDSRSVLEIQFERSGNGFETCSHFSGTQQVCSMVSEDDFRQATIRVADEVSVYLQRAGLGAKLDLVVIRVVAPGSFFQEHRIIDEEYVKKLKEREASAPLHTPIIVRELEQARRQFPGALFIAASDSAFHKQMPYHAREYSLPCRLVEEYDIHRFGYHGLSVSSVVRRIHAVIGIQPERLIVCHIGNGSSVTAVKKGVGVETSMGFSPSTGVLMGTRGGDIDNGALLEVMKVKKMKPQDAELFINTATGLQGLSNDSDIRTLLDRKSRGDEVAVRTLRAFAYRIQKEIASQTVALGGLDVLVLTATASLRSADLRWLITRDLTHLGINVGEARNQSLIGKEGIISVPNSQVKVVVMRTDEMGEMSALASEISCRVKVMK